MASYRSTKSISFFNITHLGLILVLWDIFFGLPIAFLLAHLNKRIFQHLGWENFMRSPGGARLNACIFALVNVWLVIGWAWQLMEEVREAKEENIKVLKEEIRYWDREIARLEGLLEEKQIEEQLLGPMDIHSMMGSHEYGGKRVMVAIKGEIVWKKSDLDKAGSITDVRGRDLSAAKTIPR